MANPARSFRRSSDRSEMEEIVESLRAGGFSCVVHENASVFDVTFSAGVPKEWHVMLQASDFARAEVWLERATGSAIEAMPEDHYLRSFTNDELIDVLRTADEWVAHDRAWAKELLAVRGQKVSDERIDAMRADRMQELSQPEEAGPVVLGAAVCMVLFGGFIGIVIGMILRTSNKVLPDGSRMHRYTPKDREMGLYIIVAGAMVLAATLKVFLWP